MIFVLIAASLLAGALVAREAEMPLWLGACAALLFVLTAHFRIQ